MSSVHISVFFFFKVCLDFKEAPNGKITNSKNRFLSMEMLWRKKPLLVWKTVNVRKITDFSLKFWNLLTSIQLSQNLFSLNTKV